MQNKIFTSILFLCLLFAFSVKGSPQLKEGKGWN